MNRPISSRHLRSNFDGATENHLLVFAIGEKEKHICFGACFACNITRAVFNIRLRCMRCTFDRIYGHVTSLVRDKLEVSRGDTIYLAERSFPPLT